MPGTAEQKRQERAKRKERGEVRVEVWLPNYEADVLDILADRWGCSRSGAVLLLIHGITPR